MEQVISFLSGNPLMFMIAVVIAVVIVFSFFRNVLRLLLFAVALLVLYAAWLQVNGGDAAAAVGELRKAVVLQLDRFVAVIRSLFGFLK